MTLHAGSLQLNWDGIQWSLRHFCESLEQLFRIILHRCSLITKTYNLWLWDKSENFFFVRTSFREETYSNILRAFYMLSFFCIRSNARVLMTVMRKMEEDEVSIWRSLSSFFHETIMRTGITSFWILRKEKEGIKLNLWLNL